MSRMGQEIYDADTVVVLIVTKTGRKIGWEVKASSAPKWEMTSVGSGGTHARITVTGQFYRRWQDPGAFANEIEPATPELER
jgi:hypothetical protein